MSKKNIKQSREAALSKNAMKPPSLNDVGFIYTGFLSNARCARGVSKSGQLALDAPIVAPMP